MSHGRQTDATNERHARESALNRLVDTVRAIEQRAVDRSFPASTSVESIRLAAERASEGLRLLMGGR